MKNTVKLPQHHQFWNKTILSAHFHVLPFKFTKKVFKTNFIPPSMYIAFTVNYYNKRRINE